MRHCRPGGPEAFLKQLTRDNTQLYINAMFSLPARRTKDGTVVVDVPLPQLQLPRCVLVHLVGCASTQPRC